jgi:hypothetical protein
VAQSWKTDRFSGPDFPAQPDGTLHCPAGQTLHAHERRRETDGSLRIVYAASITSCRACLMREQCQWNGINTRKPRQVSLLMHPLHVGQAPIFWLDWPRRADRRACIQLQRSQLVEVTVGEASSPKPTPQPEPLSRAERAHYRLSWTQRLARNARTTTSAKVEMRLYGVPPTFAASIGLAAA